MKSKLKSFCTRSSVYSLTYLFAKVHEGLTLKYFMTVEVGCVQSHSFLHICDNKYHENFARRQFSINCFLYYLFHNLCSLMISSFLITPIKYIEEITSVNMHGPKRIITLQKIFSLNFCHLLFMFVDALCCTDISRNNKNLIVNLTPVWYRSAKLYVRAGWKIEAFLRFRKFSVSNGRKMHLCIVSWLVKC